MKKMFCMLLILACALASLPATAESCFTLRDGIHFGDNWDTVSKKESWASTGKNHIFQYTGTIMELPSLVRYDFFKNDPSQYFQLNEQENLKSVSYCLNTVYAENGRTVYSSEPVFAYACSCLAMKYGAPITAPDIIKTFHFNPIIRYYICWLQSCNKDGCTDFDSLSVDARQAIWLIPDKNQDTLIEILEYEIVQNGQPCYLTLLNYSTLTDHEYQECQKYLTETLRDF